MARIAARAEAEASYAAVGRAARARAARRWPTTAADRITDGHHPRRVAGRRTTPAPTAILCCTRSGRTARAMARFRPSARLIGLSPDPTTVRRADAVVGRRVGAGRGVPHQRRDGVVRRRDRPCSTASSAHGDIVLVLAGAPDRDSGAATDVLRIVRVAVSRARIWSEEAGPPTARRWSCSSTARWTARPGCSSCPGGSTTTTACCATTAAATAARRPTPGRSGWTAGRRPRRPARRPPGGRVRPQLRRQRRAGRRRPPPRPRAGRRRVRVAAVVARLVAADDGRRRGAVAERGRPGRRRRAVHAPDDRRRALGAPAAGHPRRPGGPRARRWSAS